MSMRRLRLQVGLAALALALVGAAARPAVLEGAPLYPVGKELLVGVLFVIAGLAGWARRPDSRTGPLMTAAGLFWLLARVLVWTGDNSFVFTVGLVLVLAPSPSSPTWRSRFPAAGSPRSSNAPS